MIVPFSLFLLSLSGVVAGAILPGAADLLLLAAPAALASLFLLLQAWLRLRRHPPKWIVIDGSNVMHWQDGTPRIEPLGDVVRHLTDLGFTPGVVFDANAGYLLSGKYLHDRAFGRALDLPEKRVMVVPKGTPADPMILTTARDLGGRVVSNDRYRDWAEVHPELRTPGHLVRGGYRNGALWLDLDDGPAPPP